MAQIERGGRLVEEEIAGAVVARCGGERTRARARWTRCCSPPESVVQSRLASWRGRRDRAPAPPGSSARVPWTPEGRPRRTTSSTRKAKAARCTDCDSTSARGEVGGRFQAETSRPWRTARPRGRVGPPARTLRSVDFPAPFGPMSTVTRPGSRARSIRSRMTLPRTDTETWRAPRYIDASRRGRARGAAGATASSVPPTAAVTTPRGSSAGAAMVRATTSASTSNDAPASVTPAMGWQSRL